MISASSLHRAASCPASTQITPIDITGDAAIFGTANHAEIEAAMRVKLWDALPPEIAAAFRNTELLGIEMSLVYDTASDTVRYIGESKGRSYGEISSTEIPMTIDIVCRNEIQEVVVTDWKSRERVADANDNWQIKAQVLAVSRWLGVGEVTGGIWYLDNHECRPHTFTEFDFDDIRRELAQILKKANEPSNPKVGPWCKYCPAAIECPAQRKILERAMEVAKLGGTTEELYYGLKELEKFVETSLQAVRAQISARPLQLSNGKELILTERSKQAFDQGEAKRILTEMGRPIPYRQSSYTQLMERKVKE